MVQTGKKKPKYRVNMVEPIHFVPALAHLVSRGSKRRSKITETLILQQMITWYSWKVKDDSNKKVQIETLEEQDSLSNEEQKELEFLRRSLSDGWIYKSADELANGDFGGTLSTSSVDRAFEYLVENGFLWVKTNPKRKTDRTYWYRPRINYIRRELHKMGQSLYGYNNWDERTEQVEPEQKIFPPSWKGKGKKAKDVNEEVKSLPKAEKNPQPMDEEEAERIRIVVESFKSAFNGYNLQPISAKGLLADAKNDLNIVISFIETVSSSRTYRKGDLINIVGAVRSAIQKGYWEDYTQAKPKEEPLPKALQEKECKAEKQKDDPEEQVEMDKDKSLEEQITELESQYDMTKYRIEINGDQAIIINLEEEKRVQEKLNRMRKRLANRKQQA